MPGRHRKPTTPILPVATGALGVTALLLGTAADVPAPFPIVAPTPVALASFTADAPTEWWRAEAPRRAANPAPTQRQAASATAPAVTPPSSGTGATGTSGTQQAPSGTPAVTTAPAKARTAKKPTAAPAPVVAAGGKVSCRAPWLAGMKRVAQVVGCDLAFRFGISDIGGYRAGGREHGSGRALDLMVGSNRAKGDAIAEYLLANWDALGIKHVIWQQRINYGRGWQRMEDRGSATANHRDHIHLWLK